MMFWLSSVDSRIVCSMRLDNNNFFFYLHSDEGDEIVECDNCGITVHEGES